MTIRSVFQNPKIIIVKYLQSAGMVCKDSTTAQHQVNNLEYYTLVASYYTPVASYYTPVASYSTTAMAYSK